MVNIPYLWTRQGRFYFRRRLPGFSTCKVPVMVSPGTTDRAAATRLCVQFTAQMDLMLDEDLHSSLPEADVAAFFKAELVRCVDEVRRVRITERMDGRLTTQKARRNQLEAVVLRGLVEDGLREEMAPARLARLDEDDRGLAQNIQAKLFLVFISPTFNGNVQEAMVGMSDAKGAQTPDVSMSSCGHAEECVPLVPEALARPSLTAPVLTSSVTLIEGRMTGRAVLAQFEAAKAQPRDTGFDGTSDTTEVERTYGIDIAGTAGRMTWRSNAKADTKEQKLKSAILFMNLTGVQRVSEIRQHHLDSFAGAIKKKMPGIYWKSDKEKDLTSFELIDQAKLTGKPCGMAPSTIERQMNAIAALVIGPRDNGE